MNDTGANWTKIINSKKVKIVNDKEVTLNNDIVNDIMNNNIAVSRSAFLLIWLCGRFKVYFN